MLINLNASPASKTFLRSHILPTLCTKLSLTSRVTLQIKASIDNIGVLLQIKGSVSLWEFLHISFQMVTLTGRQAASFITANTDLSLSWFDHWN